MIDFSVDKYQGLSGRPVICTSMIRGLEMELVESQAEMRVVYVNGATGVLVSGLIWCLAGSVGIYSNAHSSMLALFLGGLFIFPLSVALAKLLGATGKHSAQNKLGTLAIESLGVLFGGLFVAFVAAQYNPHLFFPVMLVAIGARYLMFQTLYGLTLYWLLGGLLMASGFLAAILQWPFFAAAFIGGGLELLFAVALYLKRPEH